ncbi:hypothetical protein DMC30DRAFT_413077 [Rhodotorula diobovata]|uniref:Uncharacterized protein n=1 Tax=Rhodotorula diobovata TaxID=5288 RepID=A0A5C5G7V4_9BASI|nr:hypothetical protein DMC30DRAFT_413077 [Rhodotorula diobovata]
MASVNALTVAENRREIVRLHAQIAVLVRVLRPSEAEMRVLMRRAMQPEPFGLRLPGFMVDWAALEEQAEERAPPPAAHRPHRTAEAAREASVAQSERRERQGYATEMDENEADGAHEGEDEDVNVDVDEEEAAQATDVASETSDAEAPADEPDTPRRPARLDSGGRSFSLWGAP